MDRCKSLADKGILHRVTLAAALSMLTGIAAVPVAAAVLFSARVPPGAIPLWSGAGALVLSVPLLARRFFPGQATLFAAFIAGLVSLAVAASLFVAGRYHDTSYDGVAYHQEAMLQLADNGWNPFHEALTVSDTNQERWLNHYPKASWILGGALYRVTGRIDYAKSFNLMFMIIAFLLVFSAALRFERIGRGGALVLGLCAALNPVAVAQLHTLYVDGMLASLLAALAGLAALYFMERGREALWGMGAVILILCNLKFTGILYAGVFAAGLWAGILLFERRAEYRLALGGAMLFIASVALVGYNPYVTNTIGHGHPFYPIFGPQKVDFMTIQMDALGGPSDSRFAKLAKSVFYSPETSRCKAPFTMTAREIRLTAYWDARVSGFGPLFSGILLLAVIGIAASAARLCAADRAACAKYGYALLVLLASVFINPECWWARYAPQLWLVPVMALFGAMTAFRVRVAPALGGALIVANCVIIIVAVARLHGGRSAELDSMLSYLAGRPRPVQVFWGSCPFRSLRAHFRERGISMAEVGSADDLKYPNRRTYYCVKMAAR